MCARKKYPFRLMPARFLFFQFSLESGLLQQDLDQFTLQVIWVVLLTSPLTWSTAKSFQLCLTLCHPIDGSPPGSPVPGILQARTLEWVASAFSTGDELLLLLSCFSRVQLLATPWTAAYQALRPWDCPGKSTGVGCHCVCINYYG